MTHSVKNTGNEYRVEYVDAFPEFGFDIIVHNPAIPDDKVVFTGRRFVTAEDRASAAETMIATIRSL